MVMAATRRIPSFFLYGEAPRVDDDEPTLHVEPIEFRSAPHHWKISPHVHRTLHQVIFVLRGRGVSLAEGGMIEYSPPALVIVPAGTVHGFDFEPGTEGFVMSMTDDLLRVDLASRRRRLYPVRKIHDAGVAGRSVAWRQTSRRASRCWSVSSTARCLVTRSRWTGC